jgi:hypothetical protein
MSPKKKETASGHLPTYTAGIIYHTGTFIGFFLLAFHFFSMRINGVIAHGLFILLLLSSLSGVLILLKRVISPTLRQLSNADDYWSNVMVGGFQVLSAFALVRPSFLTPLFIYASALLLYIPMGKLKHVVYFFASRIYLGLFFGHRGIWPSKGN